MPYCDTRDSCQGVRSTWAHSAVGLLWHGWAWPTCATSATLPCKPNASCYRPKKATWFIRDTLVFARAPSDVSRFVLTAISNKNRELSHTTPEAATRTPEAATPATLLLPEIWGVLMLPSWDNTSAGSWCSAAMFTLSELTRVVLSNTLHVSCSFFLFPEQWPTHSNVTHWKDFTSSSWHQSI